MSHDNQSRHFPLAVAAALENISDRDGTNMFLAIAAAEKIAAKQTENFS